jgi:hypothetical protein
MAVELTAPRCQVRRYLPKKQRYMLELLEPMAGGEGAGQCMDVRPANFVLSHLPTGTRCVRAMPPAFRCFHSSTGLIGSHASNGGR